MLVFSDKINNIEDIKKADIIVFTIYKYEIVEKNYKRILEMLETLKKCGKVSKEKLMIVIDGYNSDTREIYEVKEIREYIKYIYEQYRYMFYFLTPLDNNRTVIYACLNDVQAITNIKTGVVSLHIIYNEEIRNKTIVAMKKYGKLINEPDMQRIIFTFN